MLALDATVQAYQGAPFPTSLIDGTPVLLGVAEIHRVNRAGFRHALAALPFSMEETREVIEAVVDTGSFAFPSCHISLSFSKAKVVVVVSPFC